MTRWIVDHPQLLTGRHCEGKASPDDEALVRESCRDHDPKPKFNRMREAERECKLVMEEV